ncbi:hypothetical protein D5086_006190, partial [Populus alba]
YNLIVFSSIFIFVAIIIPKVVAPSLPPSLSLSSSPILNIFKVSLSVSKVFVVAKRILLLRVYAFNFVLCIKLFVIIIVIVV